MKPKIIVRWTGLLMMVSALVAVISPTYEGITIFKYYWGYIFFLLWFFCYTFSMIGLFFYVSSLGKKWTGWLGLFGQLVFYIYWDIGLWEIGFGFGFILLAAAVFFSKALPRWVSGLWLLAGALAFTDQLLPRSGFFSYFDAWNVGLGAAAFVTGIIVVRKAFFQGQFLIEQERDGLEKPIGKATLIRLSGWALIVASLRPVIFIIGSLMVSDGGEIISPIYSTPAFSNNPKILGFSIFLSPFFMLVGLLGLRTRYGEAVGIVGKLALTAGAFGEPLLVYIGQILNVFFNGAAATAYLGLVFGLFCLAVFGITALIRKPLPHLNWLPASPGILFLTWVLITTIWQSAMRVNSTGNGEQFTAGSPLVSSPISAIYIWILMQFAATLALGFILKSDIPKEQPLTTT
jgi:hypothetical protein